MPELPDLAERTLPRAFDRALADNPDRVAHVQDADCWTYAQSHQRSLRLAGGLRSLGAQHQHPVALLLDNSIDAVHSWFALGLCGMIEVPVNTAFKGRFLAHVLNDSGAELLVVEQRYCARLADIADELPRLRTVVVRGGSGDELPAGTFRVVLFEELDLAQPLAPHPADPAELTAYMYTSGTTGPAKGVLVSQAHAYTYASREDAELPTEHDRVLVTLPLFHLAGQWYGVYQALIHHACCVLEPTFSPSRFWDVVREHGITFTVLLGAMSELLQQQPARADDADNPLRMAPMAPLPSDVHTFRRRFGTDVGAVYGMTECGAVLGSGPDSIVGGEAGFPRSGYQLRIVDAHDMDVEPGRMGELLVKPDIPHTVMSGYHNLPDTTAEVFRDGWLHTGDGFRRDAEDRFYFCDRIKDALRRRGENVSSFEVGSVLNEHSAVYESAVISVLSKFTEDDIKAVVVAREGQRIEPRELTEFLIDRLPYFMVPRYLEFIDGLPKTPTQKVQKHLLREGTAAGQVWDREAAGIVLRRGD